MKNLSRLMLSAALVFLVVNIAKADPVTLINGGASQSFVYQSTNFSGSHASATFSLSGNVLTVVLSNTSTELSDGTFVNAFGFNSTPNIIVSNFVGSGATANWHLTNGFGNIEVATTGGGNDRIVQCNLGPCVGTLTFTLQNFNGNLTIDFTQVQLTSLGVGDNGSEKPPGTGTPVPEPATMLLLGAGLSGLASIIRRQRRGQS